MMRSKSLSLAMVLAAALLGAPIAAKAQFQQEADKVGRVSEAGIAFVKKIAQINAAETAIAEIAKQKAQNESVKKFAHHLLKAHRDMNKRLQGLAARDGIVLPVDTSQDYQQMASDLGTKSGADFDRAYLTRMRDLHQSMIGDFKTMGQQQRDQDIQTFARNQKHVLEEQLADAERLLKTVGGASS